MEIDKNRLKRMSSAYNQSQQGRPAPGRTVTARSLASVSRSHEALHPAWTASSLQKAEPATSPPSHSQQGLSGLRGTIMGRYDRLRRRPHYLAFGGITAMMLLLLTGVLVAVLSTKEPKSNSHSASAVISKPGTLQAQRPSSQPNIVTKTPNTSNITTSQNDLHFIPAVPSGQPQLAKPPSGQFNVTSGTYAFHNLYMGTPILVIEHKLTPDVATNQTILRQTATHSHASDTFPIGTDTGYTGMYHGTQTLLFVKYNLLIAIQTSYMHAPSDWLPYINDLQVPKQ